MQRRLAFPVRRVVQEWVDDPERRLMVAERLRSLGIHIEVAQLLDHVVEQAALVGVEEGRKQAIVDILDRNLNDAIEGLTTALASNPVLKVTVRRNDHKNLELLDDSTHDGGESSASEVGTLSGQDPVDVGADGDGVDPSNRSKASPWLWRSVVETHGMRISQGNLRSVSALINWVNVQGDASGGGRVRSRNLPRQPWPKRLPWPRAGVRREQALMWPAIWLSGETALFPLSDGRDPSQRRRSRRIGELLAQHREVEELVRETVKRAEEGDRG